ncbi:hypothetical protein [Burkholderia sp. Nafp2/4-1b]|uniref:hypothetical protein n=1 Tax=Burkholderia sp. Nafp2/4-1b TaxID=2116686 RepID=UPI0013CEAA93|nr:hypothetical protein [Burkholderia sp. Nafp2/4-1b]
MSRLARLSLHTATSQLTLSGRVHLASGKIVMLKGFKDGIGGALLIESVEHGRASRGWSRVFSLNWVNAGKPWLGAREAAGELHIR